MSTYVSNFLCFLSISVSYEHSLYVCAHLTHSPPLPTTGTEQLSCVNCNQTPRRHLCFRTVRSPISPPRPPRRREGRPTPGAAPALGSGVTGLCPVAGCREVRSEARKSVNQLTFHTHQTRRGRPAPKPRLFKTKQWDPGPRIVPAVTHASPNGGCVGYL